MRKKILWITAGFALFLLLLPLTAGIALQYLYKNSEAYYNHRGRISVQIENFHRGWFTSEAKINIKVVDPNLIQLAKQADIPNPQLFITVIQKIHHGPFLWDTDIKKYTGLACIHNEVHFSPDIEKIFHTNIMKSADIITLTGNYILNINLPFIEYHKSLLIQATQGIKGNVIINIQQDHFIVDIVIPTLILSQENGFLIQSTNTKISFDRYKSLEGLWLGKTNLTMSNLSFKNIDNNQFIISNLHFKQNLTEVGGQLQGINWIDLDKLNINEQLFGPINLLFKASGLNTKAVKSILDVNIMNQLGELDLTALQSRFLNIFPTICTTNVIINIQSFRLATTQGVMTASGYLTWPPHAVTPDLAATLLKADVDLNIDISKALAQKMMDYATQIPILKTDNTDANTLKGHWNSDISQLLKYDFITEDNDSYQVIISRKDGLLRLNGRLLLSNDSPAGI
jgi:uncharacterized protein YdgA (DUF945 family)